MSNVDYLAPEDKWVILNSMFKELGLVRQHLDSFNNFIKEGLQIVVDEEGSIHPDSTENFYVDLETISLGEPIIKEADGSQTQIWPMDARTRNLTYAAELRLKMRIQYPEDEIQSPIPAKTKRFSGQNDDYDVFIGYLPIMLRSDHCRLSMNSPDDQVMIKHGEDPKDPGGYFIVNGSERVLVTQEDLSPNRILVERLKNKPITSLAKVFSTMKGFRAPVTLERSRDGSLRVSFPSVSRKISLVVLLRALGLEKDGAIARRIGTDPKVQSKLLPILQAETVRTQEQALDFIGKRVAVGQTKEYRMNRTQQVLDRYLLPHLGNDENDRVKKAYFLCLMAQRVLELESDMRQPDDKDHYASKRLNLAGDLLLLLFRNAFRSLTRDIKYQLERNANKKGSYLKTAVRADVITERLRHALATGNWVGGKAGVSQLLDRTNYMSALSHLRRVVSPLSRSQPHFEARDLHPTHWGKICPNETPEGPNCVLPNTRIMLPSGSSRQIGSFRQNWEDERVISVNWNADGSGDKTSKVADIARLIRNPITDKTKIYRIETETGRFVYATADHPFYHRDAIETFEEGRIDAHKIKVGHELVVLPTSNDRPDWTGLLMSDEISQEVILDNDNFVSNLPPYSSTWKKTIRQAKELGLLPLNLGNQKLPTLLRLLGFALGDGHLSLRERTGKSGLPKSSVSVIFSGKPHELQEIKSDLEYLGFTKNKIIKSKVRSVLESGQVIEGYSTQLRLDNQILWTILKALGAKIGDKAKNVPQVPSWILLRSDNEIYLPLVREFLSGLFGSELSTPSTDKRDGKTFLTPIFCFNVIDSPPHHISAQHYVNQLKDLLTKFGISVSSTTVVEGVLRKSGKYSAKYKLRLSSTNENLLNLYGRIGYAYETIREKYAQFATGYIRFAEQIKSRRVSVAETVLALRNSTQGAVDAWEYVLENHKSSIISGFIDRNDVNNWYNSEQLELDRISVKSKTFPTFSSWINNRAVSLDSNIGLIWETVTNISLIDPDELNYDYVDDFTINDDSHNFFANGFLTGNCGLVKNLALQAYISTQIDSSYLLKDLLQFGVEQTESPPTPKHTRVFLDGELIGYHPHGKRLAMTIRNERRNRQIAPEVNLAFYKNTNEVQINSDQGRVRRPVIVIKDGKSKLTSEHVERVKNGEMKWKDLVRQGLIEYLDAEEEENAYIAISTDKMTKDHTHLEISPATILGICASLIPFPEHNRSDRNVYEAGMAKQSLGLYAANFKLRLDTRAHILHYPQKPLVRTHGMTAIGFDDRPAGQNFVVAVLSYGGYNMEDALIMNRSSVNRGLGRSTFFRSYDAEERKYPGGQEDLFEIPSDDVRGFKAPEVYKHLAEDGVVEPETEVNGKLGEVIIGRTSPPRFLDTQHDFDMPMQKRRETSVSMRFGESGVADTVIFTETHEGHRLIKVKMRSLRIPEIGDKFASRHGQKGILGVLIPQEDMPFTESGLSPDLIINPHAIPSRMTIGQLMELLAGKWASVSGETVNATAFEGVSSDQIKDGLHELGYQRYGREVMYDGKTGEKLVSDVFVGVAFYQKLHHLVNDKIHARARGPVQILTRQPTEGRSREGGLKFGEMERDCLIGHGTALILKERLLDESDKSEALFCEQCGFISYKDRRLDRYKCEVCREDTTVTPIVISYAFKLLLQELMSLGIAPRVDLENKM